MTATWDNTFGFPSSAFIDLALNRTDDEESWQVIEFLPTTPESIEFLAARQRWQESGPQSYSYIADTSSQLGLLSIRYTVIDGVATEAEVLAQPFFPVTDPTPRTMEEWFEEIAGAFGVGAAEVDVNYDKATGFPAQAGIDFERLIADEERSWVIRDLVILD